MSPGKTLESDLRQILPPGLVRPAENHIPTRFTVFPQDAKQICDLVTLARKTRITLLPVGGATQLYPPPSPLDVAVSLSEFDSSIQHNPHDLTATAPAGMPFAAIQKKLAEKGQSLPLDSPSALGSTLGGVISSNRSGPLRHRYGTARDWILGTAVVNGHGQVSRAGGKVVKNVSGYDLNKLYIGSRGTLGILIEVSFKLHPLPESQSSLSVQSPNITDLLEAVSALRRSPVTVEALAILKGNWMGKPPGSWLLVARLAGSRTNLPKQKERFETLIGQSAGAHPALKPEEDSIWERIEKGFVQGESSLVSLAKISLGIRGLRTFLQEDTLSSNPTLWVKAYPGSGVGYVGFPTDGKKASPVEEWAIQTVKNLGGFVEFEILPPGSTRDRWPILLPSLPWMKKIKQALDPGGVFAPGTFVGGI